MRRIPLVLILLGTATLAGCPAEKPPGQPPLLGSRPLMPADKIKNRNPADHYVLLVCVRMMTVSLPVGTVSGSERLWSYLDEEKVATLRSANLGRNGFRVGVAAESDWKDVQKLLEEMTGRSLKMVTMICRPGEPLPIRLRERQPVQTLFVFSDDGSLSGKDYPPGDNLVTLYCTLNEDNPSKVMITGLPQIQTTAHRPQFITDFGQARMVARPDYFSFDEATFRITVPSRDFLIIGPGSESRRRSSIGHGFLVGDVSGVEYETVLVLIPEVYAAAME